VQAKLSLHLDNATKGNRRFTVVGLWGNYILKPQTKQYPFMPEVEDCTMHLAELFKIAVVPHALIPLQSGELAYITRRIDRNSRNNKPIHMEDFCQLSGKLTEQKYRGSMESIAKLIRYYSSNALFDILSFFEISLFTFLTGNGDMHLKNFSLIHNENGLVTLTPAYDLLSTRLFISEEDDNEEMALTLNGKKRKFSKFDFIQFGKVIGLNQKQIDTTFKRFSRGVTKVTGYIDRSFMPHHLKEEYKVLVGKRATILEI